MFLQPSNPKRILIAPLDWGMGHTTRCMPLIRHLESKGHRLLLAGNEQQRAYWGAANITHTILPLDGYNIHYSRYGFLSAITLQIPKVLRAIKAEQRWLREIIKEHKIDGIISDNRYGLFHREVPTVILTHQLNILSGLGELVDIFLQKLHYSYLSRFSEIWVPDAEGKPGLAGTLSHPDKLPAHVQYLGILSALAPITPDTENHILILLSGPEPQRTILSRLLWNDIAGLNIPAYFVEGSKTAQKPHVIPNHIKWFDILPPDKVQEVMTQAQYVICRSGYSTIMDLTILKKKAILIPTPGQTEQEYLSRHLQKSHVYPYLTQKNFSFNRALTKAKVFPYQQLVRDGNDSIFKQVLDNWTLTL